MNRLGVIIGLCIVALVVSFSIFSYFHVTTIEGVVTDKYNKRDGKADKFYIVVKDDSDNETVLENTDSTWMFKWDSADIQAKVKEGKRYKVELRGWRVPILSMFPNVDNIKEVKGEK